MKNPQNRKPTVIQHDSHYIIKRSMQQLWGGYVSSFSGFCSTYRLVDMQPIKKEVVPYCCIFDYSTSTKHSVAHGSGQDQELEVEQNMRIATEQKGQTCFTNHNFCVFGLEAVQNVHHTGTTLQCLPIHDKTITKQLNNKINQVIISMTLKSITHEH